VRFKSDQQSSGDGVGGVSLIKNADIVRPVCIWFMVAVHIDADIREVIVQRQEAFLFLFDGLSRIASPGLGLISGYLAWISLERWSAGDFLLKRARNLLLPFLLWSMVFLVLRLLLDVVQGQSLDLRPFLGNEFWGLTDWPRNAPLHYLVDLFKSVVLMVAAFVLFKRLGFSTHVMTAALLGFSLVVFAGLTLVDLHASHPGRNPKSFLPRSDLLLFFALGFVYARAGLRIFENLSRRPLVLAVLGVCFFGISLIWSDLLQYEVSSRQYWLGLVLHFICRLAGVLVLFALIWRLPAPGEKTSLFFRDLAFAVFVSHFIVLSALNSLLDLTPLLAYSPALYVLTMQVASLLTGLAIVLLQRRAASIGWPGWWRHRALYRHPRSSF
jgi:fucose 4-O-acetylase-like acetyltransferase